jgi:hypothetical protein
MLRPNGIAILAVLMSALLAGCASTAPREPEIRRISPEELERIMPKPVPNLTLDEIVRLSKEGSSPEQIIEQIKATNSRYDLTPSETLDLSKRGVSSKVLDYIHASREQALRDGFADEINKREKEKRLEEDKLRRELRYRYYDPYWGYGYSPYYRPFYGPGFGPGFGPRFGYGFNYRHGW